MKSNLCNVVLHFLVLTLYRQPIHTTFHQFSSKFGATIFTFNHHKRADIFHKKENIRSFINLIPL